MKVIVENRQLQQWKASLFYLGLFTLVTSVVWIGGSVYGQFAKSTVDTKVEKQIKPLSPTLDIEAVRSFAQSRIVLPEQYTVTALVSDGTVTTTSTINPFDGTIPTSSTVQPASPTPSPDLTLETVSVATGSSSLE